MDLSKQLERAREAANRGNDEYAVQLYQDLLALDPDNLQARKELLEAEGRMYAKQGVASAGKAKAFTQGLAPLVKANIYAMMNKHDQVMIECEKFLQFDPRNRNMRKTLAKAARAAGHRETAIWVYEWLAETDTQMKDAATLYALGELNEERANVDAAIQWFERYGKAKPNDRNLVGILRNLDAQRTMKNTGWDEAGGSGGFKRFIRDEEEAKDLQDEHRMVRTLEDWQRTIDRIQRDLAEAPDSKKLVLQLGDTYRDGADYQDYREVYAKARECYEKARELDKGDATIGERLEDIRIREFDRQIAGLAEKAGDKPSPAQQAEMKELRKQRSKFALDAFINRVKNRPTDSDLRFQLGELYFRNGQMDDAVQQYQFAQRNPKLRKQALNRRGQCMMKKGISDLAIACFEEALKNVTLIGPVEKEILYYLGTAAETAGDTEKAEGAYKKIYETDIAFKDVAKKIEEIYRRRSTDGGSKSDQE